MKLALGIEYNGTRFHGWQKQPGKIRTVQSTLEYSLSKVADEPIHVICAGRTDAGVHGLAQVVHFETIAVRKEIAWVFGVNSFLPSDIRVLWMQVVEEEFHARFSATARDYEYVILNKPNHSAVLHSLVTWECRPLNINSMQKAAEYLIGTHDFSSFRSSECQAKSPIRTIELLQIIKKKEYIHISIRANAFLHHMVRNIIGTLLEIGKEYKPIHWMHSVLAAKSREVASRTAPASGLYLTQIIYPDRFLKNNIARTPCYVEYANAR